MGRELRAQRFEHRYGVSSKEVELLQLSSHLFVVCIHITNFPRKGASFFAFLRKERKLTDNVVFGIIKLSSGRCLPLHLSTSLRCLAPLSSTGQFSSPSARSTHTHARARALTTTLISP